MNRVGEFEKVSFEQFYTAMSEIVDIEQKEEFIRSAYDNLALPNRATSGSAGYDFKSPFDFTLKPGQTIKIPTGIRVKIDDGWWLGGFPRSGLGFNIDSSSITQSLLLTATIMVRITKDISSLRPQTIQRKTRQLKSMLATSSCKEFSFHTASHIQTM